MGWRVEPPLLAGSRGTWASCRVAAIPCLCGALGPPGAAVDRLGPWPVGHFGKEQLVVYGTCSRVCVVLDILAQGPHPSTFLAPTSHWWWKGCMSLAPTGLHTLQLVGSLATAAVGSSHLVELLVALIVVIITTCWCCIRRACRSCGTRRLSIQLPSGFEVSINGTD